MAVIRTILSDFHRPLTERSEQLNKYHVSSYSESPRDSFIDKIEKNFGLIIILVILLGALAGIAITFLR